MAVHRFDHLLGVFLQLLDGAAFLVLDVQFEAIGSSETGNHGLCVHLYLGVRDVRRTAVYLFHDALYVVAPAFALAPVLQFDGYVAV